jgi:predicted tellurium resistance membrane protein TerC
MAWANDRGRRWARIVAAVLFTINTLDLLLSIDVVHAIATVIVGAVIWVVGLAVIVLLFRKESAPFYQRGSA